MAPVRLRLLLVASQARHFRAVAELNALESREEEEEELFLKFLQREKSLVAFENVTVTWDSGYTVL